MLGFREVPHFRGLHTMGQEEVSELITMILLKSAFDFLSNDVFNNV